MRVFTRFSSLVAVAWIAVVTTGAATPALGQGAGARSTRPPIINPAGQLFQTVANTEAFETCPSGGS